MKKTLVFLLSGLLVACSSGKDDKAAGGFQMPPAMVTVAHPTVGDFIETLTIAGTLNAKQSALLRSEIAGIVEQIYVKDGQSVKAGDLLFAIDHKTLAADVKKAEANVALSQEEQRRMQSLLKQHSVSQYDVDKANAELLTAQANYDYAKAQLDKADIKAPFDGTLGIRQINRGAYVQPGTALISIVNLNPLFLDFSAPETVLNVLHVGNKLQITVPALNNLSIDAHIVAVEPEVSADTRSVKVRASVSNDEGHLRPGLFARVQLPIRSIHNVLWLPEAALFYQDGRKLLMLDNQGKSLRQEVNVIGFENGKVAISSGITKDDTIVIGGHHKMPFDGMPMMVADQKPSQGVEAEKHTPANAKQAQ